jgi:hypothetical protein
MVEVVGVGESKTRGARLAVREARLITKELRHLGVPPRVIAKIWATVVAIPVVFVLGYLLVARECVQAT